MFVFLKPVLTFLLTLSLWGQALASPLACQSFLLIHPKKIKKQIYEEVKQEVKKQFSSSASDPVGILENLILWRVGKQIALHKKSNSEKLRQNLADQKVLLTLLNRLQDPAYISWVKRELLAQSLESVALRLGLKQDGLNSRWQKILNNKALRFLLNPFKLPSLMDKTIPEPLLQKVLRDGVKAHEKEIIESFQASGQSKVEAYRYLARSYQVVALGVLVFLLLEELEQAQEDINHAHIEKLENNLDSLEGFLQALDAEMAERGIYK